MHYIKLAALLLIAMGIATPVLAAPNAMNSMHNAMSGNSLKTNMGAQNGSNQTGTATVKNVTGGVNVTISLKNEPSGASEPAHIHQGTCAKLNPAPFKPLSNVVNGTSTTTVSGVTVSELKRAHYAVNVHQSAANLGHYVACGDL